MEGTGIPTLVHRVGGEVLLRLCPRVSKVEKYLPDRQWILPLLPVHGLCCRRIAVGGQDVFGVGCLMVG